MLAKSRSRSLRSLLEVDPTRPERGLLGLCSAHSSIHSYLMNSKKPLSYLFLFLQQDIHQGPVVSEAVWEEMKSWPSHQAEYVRRQREGSTSKDWRRWHYAQLLSSLLLPHHTHLLSKSHIALNTAVGCFMLSCTLGTRKKKYIYIYILFFSLWHVGGIISYALVFPWHPSPFSGHGWCLWWDFAPLLPLFMSQGQVTSPASDFLWSRSFSLTWFTAF